MLKLFRFYALSLSVVTGLVLAGCDAPAAKTSPAKNTQNADSHDHAGEKGDAHDHDHDHSNLSLADTVKEIDGFRKTIADALAANDAEKAHDPLHEIGHLIEGLPAAGTKASLSEADQAELTKSADALMEAFGKIDEGMHGKEEVKYSSVSEQIDKAMEVLRKVAKVE
jgi:hypothetical protein